MIGECFIALLTDPLKPFLHPLSDGCDGCDLWVTAAAFFAESTEKSKNGMRLMSANLDSKYYNTSLLKSNYAQSHCHAVWLLWTLPCLCHQFNPFFFTKHKNLPTYETKVLFFSPSNDESECLSHIAISGAALTEAMVNVSRTFEYNDIRPTKLRLNKLYYKIYCIGLNSIFASVIPLTSLFYLNVCTIIGMV